jgi:enoyl-CoA hydratase
MSVGPARPAEFIGGPAQSVGSSRLNTITLTERDGVALLTADRPPVNAMNLELLEELVASVEQLAGDVPAAVVLAGRPGAFSAGLDLKAVPAYEPAEQRRMVEGINAMALGVYGLRCPVVCAITGHAIAGGFVLAVCGDHRVASSEGRYGLTEVKVGVPYPQGAIGVVRAELTPGAARILVLGNRLVSAEECVKLGAFDEAVEPGAVVDRAVEVARELAELPADVYARTKAELRDDTLKALRAAVAADPLLQRWV